MTNPSRVPVFIPFAVFARLRRLADEHGTSPPFMALRLLDEALTARGMPPESPFTPDDRYDPA